MRYLSFSVIRQSSPRLNNVIVIGCLLLYCCVFLYGAEAFVESRGTHTVICKVGEYCSFRLNRYSASLVPIRIAFVPFFNSDLN